MEEEVWKPIKNWEGMYEVSSNGRVRSIRRIGYGGRIIEERIMRQAKTRGNYLTVMLKDAKTNRKKRYRVSRLVAIAFIPNPYNLPQVNHKDEDRQNNNANNLEWCDCSYNLSYNNGRERRAEKHRKEVCQLNGYGEVICVFNSATSAAKHVNGFVTNISAVCLGKMKSYKGYGWIYKQNI